MENKNRPAVIEIKQLRVFAAIVSAGFLLIGLAPMVLHGAGPRIWALAVAAWLTLQAVLYPRGLTGVYRAWMAVGAVLGWINTRIILSIGFFGLIFPLAVVMRLQGKDPMRRGFDPEAKSYRVPRTPRPSSHMKHPY